MTHAPAVLAAALRVLNSPADADDVAQEVFLEIFRTKKFAELHDQGALVRTMATRRALDRLRRRKGAAELSGREVSRNDFEPCDYAMADELERRLRAALATLPPREAEVFCLVYFEGHSHTVVSALLGVSAGAVAKSLCAARGKLSKALKPADSETRR